MELSKYFTNSEVIEIQRSQIHPASYNPRYTTDEGKKLIKQSVKTFGVVGGIVINKRTNNTIVGGHQKIYVLDQLHKYNEETNENDYLLRAEMIDVDLKTEKELNITLNNGKVGGEWDFDALRSMLPDIDYKAVGFDEADLNMIGVDFLLQTEGENNIANDLDTLMAQVHEENRQRVAERKAERQAARQAAQADADTDTTADTSDLPPIPNYGTPPTEEQLAADRQAKIDHMKDVKAQVKQQAQEKAENLDAYVVLSFDNFAAKQEFCLRFGFGAYEKFIKGEVFGEMVERIDY